MYKLYHQILNISQGLIFAWNHFCGPYIYTWLCFCEGWGTWKQWVKQKQKSTHKIEEISYCYLFINNYLLMMYCKYIILLSFHQQLCWWCIANTSYCYLFINNYVDDVLQIHHTVTFSSTIMLMVYCKYIILLSFHQQLCWWCIANTSYCYLFINNYVDGVLQIHHTVIFSSTIMLMMYCKYIILLSFHQQLCWWSIANTSYRYLFINNYVDDVLQIHHTVIFSSTIMLMKYCKYIILLSFHQQLFLNVVLQIHHIVIFSSTIMLMKYCKYIIPLSFHQQLFLNVVLQIHHIVIFSSTIMLMKYCKYIIPLSFHQQLFLNVVLQIHHIVIFSSTIMLMMYCKYIILLSFHQQLCWWSIANTSYCYLFINNYFLM